MTRWLPVECRKDGLDGLVGRMGPADVLMLLEHYVELLEASGRAGRPPAVNLLDWLLELAPTTRLDPEPYTSSGRSPRG